MSLMSFESATPWTCPYCTVINDRSFSRCDTCHQPRPGHRKRQGEKQNNWWPWSKKKPRPWSCDKCTYSNSGNNDKCASCGNEKKGFFGNLFSNLFTSRNPGSSNSSSVDVNGFTKPSEWICSQCTGRNNPSAAQCRYCSYHRAWDEPGNEDSYTIISSQDERPSHDQDVIMISHDNAPSHRQDSIVPEDIMIVDDTMHSNDDAVFINDDISDKQHSTNHWQCADCTLLNTIDKSKCSACSSTNKKSIKADDKLSSFDPLTQWECAHCSMHNSIDNQHCVVCGVMGRRAGKQKAPVTSFDLDPSTQWRCQDCSLHNSNGDFKCRVCGGRRDRVFVEKQDIPAKKLWQCGYCSLYNDFSCDTCKNCGGIYLQPKVSTETTRMLSTSTSLESSMRRPRLYTSHTAYISISVMDKRSLIDSEAMSRYQNILEFCKQVRGNC